MDSLNAQISKTRNLSHHCLSAKDTLDAQESDCLWFLRICDVFMSEFFCGRKEEIALLRRAIASERAELGIVYGRRRIGKSTLLQL